MIWRGHQNGTRPKGSYVLFVGWVHICPQARQLNHWIIPTASPPSRSVLPQLLQNCCGGGRRAGRLNDVLFWTVGSSLGPFQLWAHVWQR